METTLQLQLPEHLTSQRRELETALGTAIPGLWPEGERLLEAEQPKAIAEAIIPILHRPLELATIAYLFVEDKREGDRIKLGHAAKASAKVRLLAHVDYVIEFNWTAWQDLTPEQRIALVDHELCHCAGRDDNGGWAERGHDVEEFTEIVARWGLWKSDLNLFARTAARQLELFADRKSQETLGPKGTT